ncbi:alpha/beta fold hydrolase [Halopseudomonas nanhaiensis]|uniref:alpha/beta hydrolase n=1 Tax=Halopseudomonas nanhaiensis TaxID=2830842 RepID=UPI001CBCEF24|nr:alpha/beta fold hydrolase [Halopseudomonas nanhaiensis]UAW98979.1 alpha/beta fold hydrolase [Halopseudomonas nanhaiensis]
MSASAEQKFLIQGPAGTIEALVTRAENPTGLAVICHPNPVQGGTMHNKVVHTLMRAARDCGATTVRFNFRGVGGSDGQHTGGAGEVDDCLAVVQWAQKELGGQLPLWLMGFSFGGYVAAAAACRLPDWPAKVALIAPSVVKQDFAALLPFPGDALVVMGERDEVVPPQAVHELLEGQAGVDMVRFEDTGHFFHGKLTQLKDVVQSRLG